MTNEPSQGEEPGEPGEPAPPDRADEPSLTTGPSHRPAAVRPAVVAAVLVVHDGASWLDECLDALEQQTRPPDRLVIVDTGSLDRSVEIVASHRRIRHVIGEVRTLSTPRASTFGEAVGLALESVYQPGDWLWLLHDDGAADPEALAHLLDAARRSPSVGIAGPKLTTWDDSSRLLEVGQQITRSGGRAGGPARGEPDQGQHDHRSDVLGVSTSGMLIRRDVFEEIGGFDPSFAQFGDDLDLCWRAQLAGHRVVVVPKARMREAAASTNGQRSEGISGDTARRRHRRHVRQIALARCSPYAAPLLALWVAVSSLVSAAVLLVVKRPRRAWQELGDLGSLMTPWRPIAARWRARGLRRVERRDLRGLFVPPRVGFRHAIDTIHDAVAFPSGAPSDDRVGGAQSLETGPASDDTAPLEGDTVGAIWRIVRHPGFLAVLAGLLLSLATWRAQLGAMLPADGPGIAGGELLPVSTNASGLWHSWLDGWHGGGLGNGLEPAPFLPALAAGAWVVEHLPLIDNPASSAAAFIAWLLVGAIPLSAWSAYIAARVATRSPWPRAWAAVAWASLGTLTTAQASGRLGAVVAHILLPLVVAGFFCAVRRSAGLSMTFGTALALALTGVFNPLLAAVGAIAALLLLLVGHGATRLRAAVLLVVPIGLLGPWLLRVVDDPLLLLAGPGLTLWQRAPDPWQLGLLHPGGPGAYPVLLSAPLVLAGLVALMRRTGAGASRSMTVLAALTVAGLALGVAAPHVIIGRIPHGLPGAGGAITPWPGTGLDLAALALISASLLGFNGLPARLARSGFGWRQISVAPVVVAAVLGVVASTAFAGWLGVGDGLTAKAADVPAVAADQAEGPLASRFLLLAQSPPLRSGQLGTVGYRLMGDEPGMVARELPGPSRAPDPLLAAAVTTVVADADVTSVNATRDRLADLGIGFVAFRGASTEPVVRRLDSTAGMTRLGDSGGLILWRVQPRESARGTRADAVPSSRLRLANAQGAALQPVAVVGSHGQADLRVAAGSGTTPTGRQLVVAEPTGWAEHAVVTYAGRELAAVGGREQPTYVLPSDAGQLKVDVVPTEQRWRWGQLGLLLVVLFLAAPFGSSRSRRAA